MGLIYNIVTPTGSTWTDKEGNEKPNTMMVGRVIETAKGGKMAILDGLPFSAFGKGEPVVLYFNEPKQREGGGDAAPARERKRPDPSGVDSEDIPF